MSENEGSSMDEFLVDDDDVSDAVDSDTGNKVESQKKSVSSLNFAIVLFLPRLRSVFRVYFLIYFS